MRKIFVTVLVVSAVLGTGRPAAALIYLPVNTLESLLVRCPEVAIGTVTGTDAKADAATVTVKKTLKGELAGTVSVKGLMLRVTRENKKARFAANETVILFLAKSADGARSIMHSQVLATEADRKAMEGCVAEILPDAKVLADLANPRVKLDEDGVQRVLKRTGGE
jgi:hypothetical protein